MSQPSYVNVWTEFWKSRSSEEKDQMIAQSADYFNSDPSIKTLEDWGCGVCILGKYLRKDIEYLGVDGSPVNSPFKTVVSDLRNHKSTPDAVYIKHVLEHNPEWETILRNFLTSFKKLGMIIIFTPMSSTDKDVVLKSVFSGTNENKDHVDIPDISISKSKFEKILDEYENITYTSSSTQWSSQYQVETIYHFAHIDHK